MRLSRLIGSRFKERPADSASDGHAALLRGGYVRQIAPGSFVLLAPATATIHRIRSVLSRKLQELGCQEFSLPPQVKGGGVDCLFRLLRDELKSHAQLPALLYCSAPIVVHEGQLRAGLLRMRSYNAVLALSVHGTRAEMEQAFCRFHNALLEALQSMGLMSTATSESSDALAFGLPALDFVLLHDAGDQTLAVCNSCSYKADLAVARGRFDPIVQPPRPLERVHTPGKKTIDEVSGYLGLNPNQTAKAVFFDTDADGKLVVVLIRGDVEVNEAKLRALIGVPPVPASEERILSTGAVPGYATGMGLDPAKVRIVLDNTVAESSNLVCGANEVDCHFLNFNTARDLPGLTPCDVATVQTGIGCPVCEGSLDIRSSIKLATIAQVGSSLPDSEGLQVTDEQGQLQSVWVGYYRIGLERLMGAIAEVHCDQYGPKWPMSVAAWRVHICALRLENDPVRTAAEHLYTELVRRGIDVLYDDRNVSPGVQFADADLLGAPVRLIVSERNLSQGNVEYKRRDTGEKGVLPLDSVLATVEAWIEDKRA